METEKIIQEKLEKMFQTLIEGIKNILGGISPDFINNMLNSEAGTYFILSIIVILIVAFLRFVGGMLSFIFKVILLIATLSAIFFGLVYFFGEYFKL